MCEWFDETCGELLGLSRRQEAHRQHAGPLHLRQRLGGASTNADDPNQKLWKGYAQRSKSSPYENGIRTPIMVSWPGRVKPEHSTGPRPRHRSVSHHRRGDRSRRLPPDLPGVNLLDAKARDARKQVFGVTHSTHNMIAGESG